MSLPGGAQAFCLLTLFLQVIKGSVEPSAWELTHSLALSHPFISLTEHGNLFHPSISLSLLFSQRGAFILSLSHLSLFSQSLTLVFFSLQVCKSSSSPFCRSRGSKQEHQLGTLRPCFHFINLIHTFSTSSALTSTALRVKLPLHLTYSAQCKEKLSKKKNFSDREVTHTRLLSLTGFILSG